MYANTIKPNDSLDRIRARSPDCRNRKRGAKCLAGERCPEILVDLLLGLTLGSSLLHCMELFELFLAESERDIPLPQRRATARD